MVETMERKKMEKEKGRKTRAENQYWIQTRRRFEEAKQTRLMDTDQDWQRGKG